MLKILALVLCLLVSPPAEAYMPTDADVAHAARLLGLPVPEIVRVDGTAEDWNAMGGAGVQCGGFFCMEIPPTVVFVGDWTDTPYDAAMLILFHELGHVQHDLVGHPRDEWDADRIAGDAMRKLGKDPAAAFEQMVWFLYDVDPSTSWGKESRYHGSLFQRLERLKAQGSAT